jgi:hypothetical protein
MAPQKDIGVSSYEMLYGILYLGWPSGFPSFETKEKFLRNYMLVPSYPCPSDRSFHFIIS